MNQCNQKGLGDNPSKVTREHSFPSIYNGNTQNTPSFSGFIGIDEELFMEKKKIIVKELNIFDPKEYTKKNAKQQTLRYSIKTLKWLAINRMIDPGLKHKTAYFRDLKIKKLAKEKKIARTKKFASNTLPTLENDTNIKPLAKTTKPTSEPNATKNPTETIEPTSNNGPTANPMELVEPEAPISQKIATKPIPVQTFGTTETPTLNNMTAAAPMELVEPETPISQKIGSKSIPVQTFGTTETPTLNNMTAAAPMELVEPETPISQKIGTKPIPVQTFGTTETPTLNNMTAAAPMELVEPKAPISQKIGTKPIPVQTFGTTETPTLNNMTAATPMELVEPEASTCESNNMITKTPIEPSSEGDMEEILQTQDILMDLIGQLKAGAKDYKVVDKREYPYFSPLDPKEAIIGPKYTSVNAKQLMDINWDRPVSLITRKLLMLSFDRATLATHTLSGKPSPAFKDMAMPEKRRLDPDIVDDIIFFMKAQCGATAKEVRLTITNKCADEAKILKKSQQAQSKKIPIIF